MTATVTVIALIGCGRVIGRTLRNRFAAVGAGVVVTALLQSSTAAAMMTASLAAEGTVELLRAKARALSGTHSRTRLTIRNE